MTIKGVNEQAPSLSRRQNIYSLLETGNNDDIRGKLLDWFLIGLIATNVMAVILETEPDFNAQYGVYLFWFEIFSVFVFTIEYILRFWSCPEAPQYQKDISPRISRLKYVFTPMAIIDLIAIAPFYMAFLFNIDLRFLRVLRLLRIFKLTRYSEAMTTLLKVLRDEINSFAAAIFIMLVIMIIAASGIYLIEHEHQPEVFGSIPQSMWWSIVTLTTVGYGDVYPVTLLGKFFAALIMVAGVGLVALPTGILASSFSDNLYRGREKMTKELSEALNDGVIDEIEEKNLGDLRKKLGLSEVNFEELKSSLIEHRNNSTQGKSTSSHCPHCGKGLEID